MSMSVSASSNALSYLQSLLAQGTAGTASAASSSDPLSALLQTLTGSDASSGQTAAAPSGTSPGTSPFGNDTMAALISLQGQSANGLVAQTPSQLFAKLDTNGDGQISKSEFETALGKAGVSSSTADSLFAKLDTNGNGSVSQTELAAKPHGHHHMHGGGGAKGGGGSDADSLLSATGADGATTQTSTNADGSTTTTITYSDGSTIASTSPAVPVSSGTSTTSSPDSSNLLKQLVQMQSQLLTAASSTLSTVA